MHSNQNDNLLKQINFRCYAELNDFLPVEKRQKEFKRLFKTPVTVGEVIESLGIPLSEVDLVLVNGSLASREHRLFENDHVSVYPTFETFDISTVKDEGSTPLRVTRFILDAHLGKLAKYLRMLGFDTLYKNDIGDDEIIKIAAKENRIILSRDKLLLKSKLVTHGYYVRSISKHEQLKEVVRKFDLHSQFKSFTRCMTCNSELVPKQKQEVIHQIQLETAQYFNDFYLCPTCKKVYWKGSHFKRMENLIRDIAASK